MQAYSLDLRERVISAYENGVETILEVAERFEVSDSFIKNYCGESGQPGRLHQSGIAAVSRNACRRSIKNGWSKQFRFSRI